ncbi:MAG: tail fiber domain-containing protein [Candidatus Spechtbacterales bacterium]|nr:tail fiber domain-containing protein [Candidatus Spechtbacterales bacterium]
MKKDNYKKILKLKTSPLFIFVGINVIFFTFVFALFTYGAWSEPDIAPPSGNASPPLNASNIGQFKVGGLTLNTGGATNGLIVEQGRVGIGSGYDPTALPIEPLDKFIVDDGGNIDLRDDDAADPGDIVFRDSTGTQLGRIWSASTQGLAFSSGDTVADLSIDNLGNVVGAGIFNPVALSTFDTTVAAAGDIEAQRYCIGNGGTSCITDWSDVTGSGGTLPGVANANDTLRYNGTSWTANSLLSADAAGLVTINPATTNNRMQLNPNFASGVYDDATSNAPYGRISADSFHTNGLGVGQMFIEGRAIDSNIPIAIGAGLAGGQPAQNVGIGGAPSTKFDILDNSGTANARFQFSGNISSGYRTRFLMNDSGLFIGHNSGSRDIYFQTNDTTRITIKNNGLVGIGTTGPDAQFDVESAGKAFEFRRTNTTGGSHIGSFYGGANDGNYEWIGFYSGVSRAGIILWDGIWSGCDTGKFCISGDSHELQLGSNTGNVLIENGNDLLVENGGICVDSDGDCLALAGSVRLGRIDATDSTGSYIEVYSGLNIQGRTIMRDSSPTTYYRDTDHRSGMVHVNSDQFYVLRGCGDDDTSWCQTGGAWPLVINLNNNDASFGGNLSTVGTITMPAYTTFNPGGGGVNVGWENNYWRFRFGGNSTPAGIRIDHYDTPKIYLQRDGDVHGRAFYYTSDIDLKEDLAPIDSALDKVLQLNGYSYKWRENGKADLGVIAQEVEKVFPELVTSPEEGGYKNVDYGHLVAPMIEAIKEQQEQIESLENRIEELESKIE